MNATNFMSHNSPAVEYLPVNGHYFATRPGLKAADAQFIIGVHQLEDDHILTQEEWEREQKNKAERRKHAALRARTRPTRYCLDCGTDITHMNGNAKRCVLCRGEHERELWRLGKERAKTRRRDRKLANKRYCADCGVEITEMHSLAQRCPVCKVIRERKARR